MKEILHHRGCTNLVNNTLTHILTGAGFPPSTVPEVLAFFQFPALKHPETIDASVLGTAVTCNLDLQRHLSSHKSRHPASCPHSQLLQVSNTHISQTHHFRSLPNNSKGPIAWCMCCSGALRIDSVWKEARVIVEG